MNKGTNLVLGKYKSRLSGENYVYKCTSQIIVRLPELQYILRFGIMMDEFDDGIEVGEGSSGSSKLAMMALLIGMVGIVVGVTGIILANKAQKNLQSLEAKLLSEPDKVPELVSAVEGMEDRLVKLGSEFVKLGRQDRQLQENTQVAFDSVIRDVKANREGINSVTTRLSELVEKLENWNPPRTPAVATEQSEPADDSGRAPAETGDNGQYIVQSGDTLSGIAKKHGISLSQIQAANPSVNPRALQIGQVIIIP